MMGRVSHNHGPSDGRGMDCSEHPIGACLVVIDPEDERPFERMRDYLESECDWFGMREGNTIEHLRDAVRSLLEPPTPPKPDEPTGLGAVVEDAEGKAWVLVFEKGMWQRADDREVWTLWGNVPAVRVLAEGVTA